MGAISGYSSISEQMRGGEIRTKVVQVSDSSFDAARLVDRTARVVCAEEVVLEEKVLLQCVQPAPESLFGDVPDLDI